MRYLSVIIIFFASSSCAWKPYQITTHFNQSNTPPVPDYSKTEAWSALPDKKDMADAMPIGFKGTDAQAIAAVDVFFLHPTIYTGQPTNQYDWNADINDATMNASVDGSTILNQATAFNGIGRVFAPRYRQAHYYCFVTPDKNDKKQALDLAYEDIKAAFEYYLKNYNNGRPIIIAAHSQGTIHSGRLLKEFFDGKPLQKQLVEAYLIGIATQPDYFTSIKPSQSAEDVGGFVSWNTYSKGFYPKTYLQGLNTAVCTNPLSWKLDDVYVSSEKNSGGVAQNFTFADKVVDAQCQKGVLWISELNVKGGKLGLAKTKIWHKADINFYWNNIRENAALRVANYFKNAK
jgi:Protein of unknown function (DUF3089)